MITPVSETVIWFSGSSRLVIVSLKPGADDISCPVPDSIHFILPLPSTRTRNSQNPFSVSGSPTPLSGASPLGLDAAELAPGQHQD
jgi:hypothetical protein